MITTHSLDQSGPAILPERRNDLRVALQLLGNSEGKNQFQLQVVSPYLNLLGSYLVTVEPSKVRALTDLLKQNGLDQETNGSFREQALSIDSLANVLRVTRLIQDDAVPNIEKEILRLREAQASVSKIAELTGWYITTGLVGMVAECNADRLDKIAEENSGGGFVWLDMSIKEDGPFDLKEFKQVLQGALPQVSGGRSKEARTAAPVPTLNLYSYYYGSDGLQRSPVFAAVGERVFVTAVGENGSAAVDDVATELIVLNKIPADPSSLLLQVVDAAQKGTAVVLRKYEEILRGLQTSLGESRLEDSDFDALERLDTLIGNLAQMKLDQAFLHRDLAAFDFASSSSDSLQGWQQACSVAEADIDVMRELHGRALHLRLQYQEELDEPSGESEPAVESSASVVTGGLAGYCLFSVTLYCAYHVIKWLS